MREFEYDASGNRVLRKVLVVLPMPPPPQSPDFIKVDEMQELQYFVEEINEVKLKILPNPTTEKITLEIIGFEKLQFGNLKLYSLSGQLLQEAQIQPSNTVISLAGLAKGIYILKVTINKQIEEWEVVKQ